MTQTVAHPQCHFLNFYQNFLNFFWWKIWQIRFFFHLIIAFGSICFWLWCDVRKMNDHFQHPLWHISIILSKLATISENDSWCQLSPKFLWTVLMKIEGIQAISVTDGYIPPFSGFLGLKGFKKEIKIHNRDWVSCTCYMTFIIRDYQ